VLQVNGDSPTIVQVGTTYTDLGATITGPQADLNLGITTYVNGAPMNPVQLDTSTVATDTIAYVATDSAGLTSHFQHQAPPQRPSPNDPALALPKRLTEEIRQRRFAVIFAMAEQQRIAPN
jgi:hypothetical protein